MNAIGTAFLRADFLEGADKQQSQVLLKRYVQIRMHVLDATIEIPNMIIAEGVEYGSVCY